MRINLYVPDDLATEMELCKGKVNLSRLFQEAFQNWLTDGQYGKLLSERVEQLELKLNQVRRGVGRLRKVTRA